MCFSYAALEHFLPVNSMHLHVNDASCLHIIAMSLSSQAVSSAANNWSQELLVIAAAG